jgi:hypothetical protein
MYGHHIAWLRVVDAIPGPQDVFYEVDDAHCCSCSDEKCLMDVERNVGRGSLEEDRGHVPCLP